MGGKPFEAFAGKHQRQRCGMNTLSLVMDIFDCINIVIESLEPVAVVASDQEAIQPCPDVAIDAAKRGRDLIEVLLASLKRRP